MCGIAGVYNSTSLDLFCDDPAGVVEGMLDKIKHRGPDASGIESIGKCIHGHVRLSLVDLSSGSDQPFVKSSSVLSFNGEIWNYKELKRDLNSYSFKTKGDTEVLMAQLDTYGLGCLNRLDGMFAFAYSSDDGHYLVRDRHGKIPLYYCEEGGSIKWASERKAFSRHDKPVALPAGHILNLESGELSRWYNMKDAEPLDEDSTIRLLKQGVAKRMQLDADICCLISGGIDSSLILTIAKEIRADICAYTAVFDERSPDLLAARRLCSELDTKLIEVKVSEPDIAEAINTIEISSKAQIEIASLCIPLAKRISSDGFKACLSGEAADELFGGYGNFCIKSAKANDEEVLDLRMQQLSKMSRGNFVRCNKAFMAHGVECRLPFMEDDLVDRAIQSSLSYSPAGKKLLKRASTGVVPDFIIKRKKETFQGASNLSSYLSKKYTSPIKEYNNESKRIFGYRPTE